MHARVQVYDITGATFAGLLPVIGLKFSEEIGGAGTCTFEALKSDMDAMNAWDSVIKIGLESQPNVWFLGPCYVIRREYTQKVGSRRYSFTCRSLLEAWASEAMLMPEYVVGAMTTHAGLERGLGWMATAYSPTGTPADATDWNKISVLTTRTTYPKNWPTASAAKWITATDAAGKDAKFFRSSMTITGTVQQRVKFWLSSDESATLWVAGEKVVETSSSETGYESFKTATRWMYPGTYAVGIYSVTDSSVGGGLPGDPVVMCAGILNSAGVVTSWRESTSSGWYATRRSVDPPNDVPPGPTPGAMVEYLCKEVGPATNVPPGRVTSGWAGVTRSFTAATDSYDKSWGALDIVERMYQYGTTSYWSIFQAFGESDECDVWMTDRTLHCAPRQGQIRNLTLTEKHMNTLSVTGTEGAGTWVMARAHSGWVSASIAGVRREYSIEVGQSITTAVATKVAKASLRDAWRKDASGSLNPPQTGWIPYVDFKIGDVVNISYVVNADNNSDLDVKEQMSITSMSASAGEGGLLWDLEFTEYPLPAIP